MVTFKRGYPVSWLALGFFPFPKNTKVFKGYTYTSKYSIIDMNDLNGKNPILQQDQKICGRLSIFKTNGTSNALTTLDIMAR